MAGSTSQPERKSRGMRRRVEACAFGGVLALVAPACAHPFGDENSVPRPFEVVVVNDSDEGLFAAFGPEDAIAPAGRLIGIRPNDTESFGIGTFGLREGPGGCFNQPLWILFVPSGEDILQGTRAEDVEDLVIVREFKAGECTDEEQVVVTYDGP